MGTYIGRDQVPSGLREPEDAVESTSLPTGERLYGMKIDRHGTWYHDDRPIARSALVKLFASVLRREQDGSYWLVTPAERGRIEVEDVPFVVVELATEGIGCHQTISVRSNLDDWVTMGPAHPLALRRPPNTPLTTAPAPYVEMRPGLEARLLRSVYYELAELSEPQQQDGVTRYGIWSLGRFFPLEDA